MTLKKIDFNEDLILDTGATFNSVKNKSLLAGVYVANNKIQMCTNTGERILEKHGVLLGMDNNPWLDENSMANIISFGELVKQYRVMYDSTVEDCFFCHTQTGVVQFGRTEEGLYSISLPEG